MSPATMLAVDGVSTYRGPAQILRALSLQVRDGESVRAEARFTGGHDSAKVNIALNLGPPVQFTSGTYVAIIGEDFDDEPFVEGERLHGSFGQRQQIHGIRAEVRRQWDSLATPAENTRPNLFDLHQAPE